MKLASVTFFRYDFFRVREDHVDRVRGASRGSRNGDHVLDVVARVFRFSTYLEQVIGAAFATADLSRPEADLLSALLRSPEPMVPPSRLAAALVCSTGTMTNRLDRLERAGLVRRHEDPHDRRGVLVALTDKGRKAVRAAVSARDALGADLVPGLALSERRELVRLLRKVLVAVEERDAPVIERSRRRASSL